MVATHPRPRGLANHPDDEPEALVIRPRRGLPGSRAVVGGLLVALSAVGTFAAASGSGHQPTSRYVVAAAPIGVGDRIRPGDLATIAIELPPRQAEAAVRNPSVLVGRVAVAPIGAGELVPPSAVSDGAGGATALVTLAVDAPNGLGGALQVGDRVDVYVSYGTGEGSSTRRVAAATEVTASSKGDGSVADAGRVEVTLAVPDPRRRIDLVNAAHAGTVTLARVTGLRPSKADDLADRLFVESTPTPTSTVDAAAPAPSTPPTTTGARP